MIGMVCDVSQLVPQPVGQSIEDWAHRCERVAFLLADTLGRRYGGMTFTVDPVPFRRVVVTGRAEVDEDQEFGRARTYAVGFVHGYLAEQRP